MYIYIYIYMNFPLTAVTAFLVAPAGLLQKWHLSIDMYIVVYTHTYIGKYTHTHIHTHLST